MGRGAARWGGLAVAFPASFALAGWALLAVLDRAEVPSRRIDLDVGVWLSRRLDAMSAAPREDARIVFLGDSLVMDVVPPDASVPTRLEGELGLRRDAGPVRLWRVISSGVGTFSHYLLSEGVARAEPDVVVLSLNLRWFSRSRWYPHERAVLVGWLPLGRWAEAATLPLHEIGVSADLALFYRLLVRLGAIEAWQRLRREQVRVVQARRLLAEALQRRSGAPAGLDWREDLKRAGREARTRGHRITEQEARRVLGEVFDGIASDHPTLRVLDALLGRLCGADTACIVYVAPINVEYLARLGVLDAVGLGRTLEVLETLVRRHGAVFVDLHDLLPDAAFVDFADHIGPNDAIDSTARVAERLAPHVRRALRARRAERQPRDPRRDPGAPRSRRDR